MQRRRRELRAPKLLVPYGLLPRRPKYYQAAVLTMHIVLCAVNAIAFRTEIALIDFRPTTLLPLSPEGLEWRPTRQPPISDLPLSLQALDYAQLNTREIPQPP